MEDQLADIERRPHGVLRAIENGAWSEALRNRLSELETRKASLQRQRDAVSKPPSTLRTSTAPGWPILRRP